MKSGHSSDVYDRDGASFCLVPYNGTSVSVALIVIGMMRHNL
jgi:hypothetical protein